MNVPSICSHAFNHDNQLQSVCDEHTPKVCIHFSTRDIVASFRGHWYLRAIETFEKLPPKIELL